jgi:hypothetical protein
VFVPIFFLRLSVFDLPEIYACPSDRVYITGRVSLRNLCIGRARVCGSCTAIGLPRTCTPRVARYESVKSCMSTHKRSSFVVPLISSTRSQTSHGFLLLNLLSRMEPWILNVNVVNPKPQVRPPNYRVLEPVKTRDKISHGMIEVSIIYL